MKRLLAVILLMSGWMIEANAQAIVLPQHEELLILLTEPQPVINAVQVQPSIFVPITPYYLAPCPRATFQPFPIYVAQPTNFNSTIDALSVIQQEERRQQQELIELYLLLESK